MGAAARGTSRRLVVPHVPSSLPPYLMQRFFTGSLAHLFVWNRSVTPEEMRLVRPPVPA